MNDITFEPLVRLDNLPTPSFPTEALPESFAEYSKQIAESLQVPIDLPAVLALSVASASIARKVEVQIYTDWVESTNLYVLAALPPGEKKSAVFSLMTQPLHEYEENLIKEAHADIERLTQERRIKEKELDKYERAIAEDDRNDKSMMLLEAEKMREQLPEIPSTPRLIVDDITPERLAAMLSENDEHIALMSSESGVFEMISGRYSNGMPNLAVYLKSHSGDALKVDRTGRETNLLSKPALTIAVTVQPSVIKELTSKSTFRGQGLIARFLFSMPQSNVGFRSMNAKPIEDVTRLEYNKIITSLLNISLHKSPEGEINPFLLNFSYDADTAFIKFREKVEMQLRPQGKLEHIADWASKLPGAVARLAGIIHMIDHHQSVSSSISEVSVKKAILIGEYFLDHALITFDLMGEDETLNGARKIIDWFSRNELTEFSRRDAHQNNKGMFKTATSTDAPLQMLINHGYIATINMNSSGPGRQPSKIYKVNPELSSHNTHKSQNTFEKSHFLNSEFCDISENTFIVQ